MSLAICVIWGLAAARLTSADQPDVTFHRGDGKLTIAIGGKPFADYYYEVPRACFANVYSPSGTKATRNFPVHDDDDPDHPHHTGIFLTFGDLNGVDFWHIQGKVVQERFVREPQANAWRGTFAVKKQFMSADANTTFVSEVCHFTISAFADEYQIEFDTIFTAEVDEVVIGSKEEGGLAARVATPLAVARGGSMVDSDGREGGSRIWGKQAAWVDHRATVDGQHVGLMVMAHPGNLKRCWWHARDYGLNAANPFGPLNDPETKTVLRRGETLRLRYAVLVYSHSDDNPFDPAAAYKRYVDEDG